jgi:hypothetical protein
MKLFGRTGGHYLFWTGFVYLFAGVGLLALGFKEYAVYASPTWITVLSLPFVIPPFGRWLNMNIDWDKNMFDFFRRRTAKDYLDEASNVYKLPAPKLVPPMPEVAPPKEEPAKIFYRIGATDQNRVAFSMGQMEITMNREGCQQLIDQLTVFMNQIKDENEN